MSSVIGFDKDILKKKYTKYRIVCPKCGAIILYDKNELKYRYDQIDRETWYEVTCPHCGNALMIGDDLKKYEYFDQEAYRVAITGYK